MSITRGGPTLEEVAAFARVSRATVSRVVNGSPKVSEEARRAVMLAIDALGYVPNRAARSLVTRRSDSVALVVTEPETRFFSEPFFATIVRGVSQELAEHELQLVLTMAQNASAEARLERYLAAGHVDGAILLSLHGADPLPERLQERGLPLVVSGRPPQGVNLPFVDADNRGGARSATAHLLERGRRRIAAITGPADMTVGRDRVAGHHEALETAGIEPDPELHEEGDFSLGSGRRAMQALLGRAPDLDAVVAASDLMAVGALQVLHDAGRRVPQDVAVVGFDDSLVATSAQPPLTTVRQPVETMGRRMAALLVAEIAGTGSEPGAVILPTELVVRGST